MGADTLNYFVGLVDDNTRLDNAATGVEHTQESIAKNQLVAGDNWTCCAVATDQENSSPGLCHTLRVNPPAHRLIMPLSYPQNATYSTHEGALTDDSYFWNPVNVSISDADGRTRATLAADFGPGDVDWSGLGIDFNASATSIDTGSIGGQSHTLAVPIAENQSLLICPAATALSQVVARCAGGHAVPRSLAQAGTVININGSAARISTDGISYIVSGLTGTGIGNGITDTVVIWDQTDAGMPYAGLVKYAGDTVTFYANFTNASGLPANATAGGCRIDIADPAYGGYQPMTWNAGLQLHTYTHAFGSAGSYDWKVRCTGDEIVDANDTTTITSGPIASDVPEFGTLALLAALLVVASGVAALRRI
jgi:hypothetical protein